MSNKKAITAVLGLAFGALVLRVLARRAVTASKPRLYSSDAFFQELKSTALKCFAHSEYAADHQIANAEAFHDQRVTFELSPNRRAREHVSDAFLFWIRMAVFARDGSDYVRLQLGADSVHHDAEYTGAHDGAHTLDSLSAACRAITQYVQGVDARRRKAFPEGSDE